MQLPVTFTVEIHQQDQDTDRVLSFLTFTASSAEVATRRALKQRCALWMKGADGQELEILGYDEIAISLENATLINMLRNLNGGVL